MGIANECQLLGRTDTDYMAKRDGLKGMSAAIGATQWLYPDDVLKGGSSALRILLIDCDSQTVEQVSSGFNKPGQKVETVADGQRGLMLAATSSYDVTGCPSLGP